MTVERYPSGLIPKCGWNSCIEVSSLISAVPDCVIARRLDGPKSLYVDDSLGEENCYLKNDTFRDKALIDMSVSLLGALLKVNDMRFRQTEEASADWDGNEVDAKKLIEKYVVETDAEWFCVCWNVESIHTIQFPYKKNVAKGAYKTFKENVEKVTGVVLGEFDDYMKLSQPLMAITILTHRPTMLNYWHFTFNVRPADSEEYIKKIGKEWSDSLFANICNTLFRYNFSYAELDAEYPVIPNFLWECH